MELKKYKQMSCTKGKLELEVFLVSERVMCIKTSGIMRPKNRKQKKLWKQEAYNMERAGKGLYKVTQCCSFDVEMFCEVIKHLIKDENNEHWFIVEDKQ